jgi:hypothetical protein
MLVPGAMKTFYLEAWGSKFWLSLVIAYGYAILWYSSLHRIRSGSLVDTYTWLIMGDQLSGLLGQALMRKTKLLIYKIQGSGQFVVGNMDETEWKKE